MNKAWVEGVLPIYRTSVLLRPASKCEVEIKTRIMKKGHSDIQRSHMSCGCLCGFLPAFIICWPHQREAWGLQANMQAKHPSPRI